MPERQHRLGLSWTCRAHLGSGSRRAPRTFLKEALLHRLRKPPLAGQLRLLYSSLSARLPEPVCPGGLNDRCHGPTLRTASCRPHSQVTHNKMLSDVKSLLTGNLTCNKQNKCNGSSYKISTALCVYTQLFLTVMELRLTASCCLHRGSSKCCLLAAEPVASLSLMGRAHASLAGQTLPEPTGGQAQPGDHCPSSWGMAPGHTESLGHVQSQHQAWPISRMQVKKK